MAAVGEVGRGVFNLRDGAEATRMARDVEPGHALCAGGEYTIAEANSIGCDALTQRKRRRRAATFDQGAHHSHQRRALRGQRP